MGQYEAVFGSHTPETRMGRSAENAGLLGAVVLSALLTPVVLAYEYGKSAASSVRQRTRGFLQEGMHAMGIEQAQINDEERF